MRVRIFLIKRIITVIMVIVVIVVIMVTLAFTLEPLMLKRNLALERANHCTKPETRKEVMAY